MSPSTHPSNSSASLADIHTHIRALEADHIAQHPDRPLTGRIIHVTHYLPVTASLAPPPGTAYSSPDAHHASNVVSDASAPQLTQVLSPPLTPPVNPSDASVPGTVSPLEKTKDLADEQPVNKWALRPRWGHAAMFAGVHSLSASHEQIVIGWLGDVGSAPSPTAEADSKENIKDDVRVKIPTSALSPSDRTALEQAVAGYKFETEATEDEKSEEHTQQKIKDNTHYVPVWLEDAVAHGHYDGYCKTTLWPLFHYLLWQDVASEAPLANKTATAPGEVPEDPEYAAYAAANRAYAKALAQVYRPGDLVWIHDYHLLLVPRFFREELRALEKQAHASETKKVETKHDGEVAEEADEGEGIAELAVIGLFVHTPFPSSEIFRCLPRRKEILDGMLAANLVVFQTYSYARHFTSSCIRVCGYESATSMNAPASPPGTPSGNSSGEEFEGAEGKTIKLRKKASTNGADAKGPGLSGGIDNRGHITGVAHCPVGVDADRVAKNVLLPGIAPKAEALRALYEGKKIIVARDKLDVVKGVVQKLRAFARLLHTYPQWIGNVVLIQVTSPALTDSPRLERQVSELVAQINGEFGKLDFVPVHHYHQTIKKDEFYALLSVADLAVITPLRDGMNTTSMEYVIAQNSKNGKKSPLVLSEFMGISATMADALQVNPWDLGGVASAIHRGLLMSDEEKATRHAKLYRAVTTHTSHTWAASLVQLLLSQVGTAHTAHQTPYLNHKLMQHVYHDAVSQENIRGKRLFLFDYDGTLTPIVKSPSLAVPSEGALEALRLLCADPANVVYIISGRDGGFLEMHLGDIEGLGMSAEHGGFMRLPGSTVWDNLTAKLDMSWMTDVEEVFKYYTERTTGSHIEIKKSSITWHYRASDPEWGLFQCRQCQDLLENNLAHKRPIEVLVGKKNLEVRPLAVNKGEIVKRILYEHPQAEFVFCAGDDKTDEDMFRALVPFAAPQTPSHTPLAIPDASSGTSTPRRKATMDAPLGAGDGSGEEAGKKLPPVELSLRPEGVFSTAVGSSSKKTLARWHVTSPQEVIESMLALAKGEAAKL
ncbi:hypothetical protein SCHPADRAFT_943330 [Schizopora paradoxa]|uniref:Uncharacterized protein n=1 Tax=Schizopora paradoxa TaxID=27342 RepID=A0A0H2RK75_9AGAM|nr:hypothetical protein SCHPADRAFT_943330 [Schizopora paradoxa]